MAQKNSARPAVKRKRSKRQQAMFRRRRIVVGIAALIAITFVVFCIYSISQGIVAVNREVHHADVYAISRKKVPSPSEEEQKSGVPDCGASNVSLSLTPASQSLAVGGTLDFTTTVKYDGSSKVGCLVDVSASGVVLTIRSGDDVIWKSDVCPADQDLRLIAKGDKVQGTITWPGDRTGSECADDATLPRVDRGTYVAQLSIAGHAKAKSDPVTVTVE
ncbi:hypothetical protein [Bifidobacterium moukalabense]|uniref:Uncharacterized protein n=1 Tax=Bifidobacterium moukalabense DSM 27321 TaxID=1435051 RepID=W4NA43_9BIFI|nr:hypothetical protein [Bifidobacterium moukalabense]ETY71932.1 hypothetical protein BMOU_0671 [Bifidobacterium moukalabense DSM 27321]